MVAGIGGASLGTEICKALRLAGGYTVYGCDVSSTAYGLYDASFEATFRVDRARYVDSVLEACHEAGAEWLIPGGEQPMALLGAAWERLAAEGIRLLANDAQLIAAFSDKQATFERLGQAGFPIPRTAPVASPQDIGRIGLPCIVKPATGSGGSVSVFFAVTLDEAMTYAEFIRRSGSTPIAQEYIGEEEGEFTIGVLSLPDARIAGSVALRRVFDAKLSVAYRGRGGLVSSGYSQGYIGEFPDLCAQAERMAVAIGSRGPINIQGRVRDGVLLPFEINPRFSASTYLRALAGFNEIDMLVRHLSSGEIPSRPTVRAGWYLRSLTEQYVPEEQLK
ncbi:ATP-grasp domain-containing protein [Cupriavidus basilensis]